MRKFRILNLLHPSSFFVCFYIFFLLMGAVIIMIWGDTIDYSLENKTILIVPVYLIVFIAGSALAPIFHGYPPRQIYSLTIINIYGWKSLGFVFWLFGLFLFLIFYIKAGTIIALSENVEEVRVTAKAGIGKYVILGNALFTVSLCFLHAMNAKVLTKKTWKLLLFSMTLISLLLLLGIGYRGPFAFLLLSILLTRYFISRSFETTHRISINYIIFGFISFFILALLGYLRYEGKLAISLLIFLWGLIVHVINLDTIIQYFPGNYEYLYGASFITDSLVVLPDSKSVFLGVYLKDLLSLSFKGEGMTVTAPGEAYINFGIMGVVLHAIFLGLLSGMVYEKLSLKKDLGSRVILFLFSINIAKIVTSGIMPILFFSIGPQMILAYLLVFLSQYFQQLELTEQI